MALLLSANLELLISDETKFKPLSQNPTKSREDSISTYLRKLKKDGIIDGTTFQKILHSGSSPGVLYGLPKVHKAGPIVSSVNTYNYNLASFLAGILQPISAKQHTVYEFMVMNLDAAFSIDIFNAFYRQVIYW